MEKIILEREIDKGDFSKAGEASSKLKQLLRKLGVKPAIIRKLSIISYELEINIIIHSVGGKIKAKATPDNIIITASDNGPGIADVNKAFQPGFSTASDEIRELGFGAGMGLNNIKKYSDELAVETAVGEGTEIEARISLK